MVGITLIHYVQNYRKCGALDYKECSAVTREGIADIFVMAAIESLNFASRGEDGVAVPKRSGSNPFARICQQCTVL